MKDDYLCIEEVEKTVHVAVSPSIAGPKVSGVIQVLEGWKRQYIQQLSGVVVNFKNVSLASGLGSIMTDQLFIHYDVKAVFSIFKPCVGNILRGIINRISKGHVGCLVHDVINVSLFPNEDKVDDVSRYIKLDNVIYFKVTKVDLNRRHIHVNGIITSDCVQLMKKYSLTSTVKNKRVVYDALLSEEESVPQSETSGKDNIHSTSNNKFSMDISESGDIDNESDSLDVPEKSEVQSDDSTSTESENDQMSQDVSENEVRTSVNETLKEMENSDSDSSNEIDIKIKKEFNHSSPDTHKHKKKLKLDKNKGKDSAKKQHKKSKGKKISEDVSKKKVLKKKHSKVDGSKSSTHKKSKKSSSKLGKSKDGKISKKTGESVENESSAKLKESPDKKIKKLKESPDKKIKKQKESTENKKSHKKKKSNELSPKKKVKSKERKEKDKKKDSDQKKTKKRKLNSSKDTSDRPSKKIKLEPPD